MNIDSYYINGKIDLVLRNGNKTLLLDYKSGANVDPQHYAIQLDLYRFALENMSWPQIEAGIYDLRRNAFFSMAPQFGRKEITEVLERLSLRQEKGADNLPDKVVAPEGQPSAEADGEHLVPPLE